MRVSNFGVMISEGREIDNGKIAMTHGTVYTVKMNNFMYDKRCDATLYIDGKEQGTWRIGPNDSITLERGSKDDGRFTFFDVNSKEAEKVGASEISRDDRGLIQVVFKGEKKIPPMTSYTPYVSDYGDSLLKKMKTTGGIFKGGQQFNTNCNSAPMNHCGSLGEREEKTCGGIRGMSAGVTGLTGISDQKFYSVQGLTYDESLTTIVSLRLVSIDLSEPRTLMSCGCIHNKVPDPVC